MSLASHAERLEARLNKIKNDERSATQRIVTVATFGGGVAASAGYRAYLKKNNKEMPKLLGLDADVAAGVALAVGGFLELGGAQYSEHALNFGVGLLAGTVGDKVAGMVHPAIATKGESYQLGASHADVSAHRGATIMDILRSQNRQVALLVSQ